MRLCLVEDNGVPNLEPLALTRPAHELLLGSATLGQKIARSVGDVLSPSDRGAMIRPHLAPIQHERDPALAVNDEAWMARGHVLVANARWVPPVELSCPAGTGPWVGLCDGRPACAWVGPQRATSLHWNAVDDWFDEAAEDLARFDVGGEWIDWPWDLVTKNGHHLHRDFAPAPDRRRDLSALAVVGPTDRLSIHERARVDPYTVFDTTNGPITVEADVWIQPFTRLEG